MSPNQDNDLTRRERREQARSQRKQAEEAAASAAAQRRRLIQLGGVLAVVVVVVAVILIVTGSGGSKKVVAPKSPQANQAVTTVTSLLAGIPQKANVLGNPNAPVTLQYFGDLECPICQQFTLGALPSIVEKYVRPGKLKIEYRALSTATNGAESRGAEPQGIFKQQQIAALAAGKQNKAWDFIELFYHEQGEEDSGYVTEKYIQGLASQVPGLNLSQWTSDRGNSAFANQLTSDEQAASSNGFTGTPSFLIGKTGSTPQKLEAGNNIGEAAPYLTAIEQVLKS